MKSALYLDEHLFDGGPPLGLERKLRLLRSSGDQSFTRRILLAVLIAWTPLALATIVREFGSGPSAHSFLHDVGVHVRFLIAVPLLILAEGDTIPRFSRIACHFLSCGLVTVNDRPRYSALVDSTKRLLNSKFVELVMFLLAYGVVVALILDRRNDLPAWQVHSAGPFGFSLAGLWHAFVSLPMLLILLIGWIWRICLWWRFTALISRFDLQLIPAHPDQCGGLRFVSISLRGFRYLGVAISSIVAGSEVTTALRTGQSVLDSRNAFLAVLGFVLALAVIPLVFFVRNLRAAKSLGIFKYGSLGRVVGREFERKWLEPSAKWDSSALEVEDFSATTDLYQVVRNVYEMRDVPLGWNNLTPIVVATAAPFIPIALIAVPLKELLLNIAKLLL